ncbi:hypothetical protein Pint_30980 [Pistacia integerrima]|uniref:Uncharacterized protein n=1 Tax=Pistacia integerrima TaxID=434235 RepID=A0ACC0XKY9_9ROSI|nr:hypothetical protein Pint_30980 [Pistacia integerrima]
MAQDAGMFMVPQTIGSVLCCKCGDPMVPNAANMCVTCLRSEVDITGGLQKKVDLKHCPELKNLNGARLIHAEFIWTEPHSKRIKVKLTVQKEVLNGAILQQSYVVEYHQQDQMCESCTRVQANPDQWVAAVQLRQHVSHRRTFFYLEQLILKHDAAARAIKIKQMDQGIDFFFIEISPIGRDDLICLPPKAAVSLGNLGPLVVCTKVTNSIALLDPFTLTHCFLDSDQYWRSSFKSLLTSRQLVEYIVLDVEPASSEINVGGSKCVLADAQVARVSDFGKNDTIFSIRTHLGHLLNPGDYALDMEVDNSRVRGDQEKTNNEYEEFLRDLEENPELRLNISLYRDRDYQASEMAFVTDGGDIPCSPGRTSC